MNPGESIPELKVTPDRFLTVRYAGASGDFNPIHIDDEFAKAVGLPRNILHGLYSMGLVAKASAALAGGDPRALKRLSVQMRGRTPATSSYIRWTLKGRQCLKMAHEPKRGVCAASAARSSTTTA